MTRSEPPPLTADRIERILEQRYFAIGKKTVAVPNVTALGHESDFLVLTGARLLLEIEVKVTIADFRADLRGRPFSAKWMRQEVMAAAAAGEPIPAGWAWPEERAFRWEPEHAEVTADRDDALALARYGRARLAPVCPNRFAYAYPVELHDEIEAEAPEWAGLMPYDRHGMRGMTKQDGTWSYAGLERAPKLLHREKASDAVRDAMLFSVYHRFWRERRVRMDAQASSKHLREQLAEAVA